MLEFPIGPELSADQLARRESLPVKPAPCVLNGKQVRLEPLVPDRDVPTLFELTRGDALDVGSRHIEAFDPETWIWRYLAYGPYQKPEEMAAALQPLIDAPDMLCLVVTDLHLGVPVGSACLMNNVPAHLKIELGHIWYSPIVQRTGVNLEATYLMLKHCFDLGYRRVEWKCDALNERSMRSALRMGFTYEGIQEQHFIIKGRNRDTAWYRIVSEEWEGVKGKLEEMIVK